MSPFWGELYRVSLLDWSPGVHLRTLPHDTNLGRGHRLVLFVPFMVVWPLPSDLFIRSGLIGRTKLLMKQPWGLPKCTIEQGYRSSILTCGHKLWNAERTQLQASCPGMLGLLPRTEDSPEFTASPNQEESVEVVWVSYKDVLWTSTKAAFGTSHWTETLGETPILLERFHLTVGLGMSGDHPSRSWNLCLGMEKWKCLGWCSQPAAIANPANGRMCALLHPRFILLDRF